MRNAFCSPEQNDELPATDGAVLAFLWAQFNAEFPRETDCLEEVYRRAAEWGIIKCHHCGNTDVERNYGDRVIKCRSCKKKSWLTAGTFFHRMKLARPWLAAIWLMEHGQSISSSKFQKLVGVAYSSAWNIFKKLTTVIQSQMGEDVLAVSSSHFSPVIGKRSRETPARAHPLAEEEAIEKQLVDDGAGVQELTDTGDLSEQERKVYNLLSAEPMQFDILCHRAGMPAGEMSATLMILELAGMATRLAGDRYVRYTPKQDGELRVPVIQSSYGTNTTFEETITVGTVIDFVRVNFHGISRKYLQNYLAAYWCHIDRAQWQLGALLRACLGFRHISDDEILDYVSPAIVKILPC